MSDTPETDDLARGNHVVPTEWAQQLERERDEIRAQLREEQQLHVQTLNERDALAAWKEARSESALP